MRNAALFIDFDGTICFDNFWRSAEPEIRFYVKDFLFGSNSDLVEKWMIGAFKAEQVVNIISQNLSIDYGYLWNVFVNDCQTMHVRGETLDLIHKAKEFHKTILITDNMDSFDRYTRPSLKLDTYFDYIANSYNYQILKDQKGGVFFTRVAEKNTVKIKNSILIDNSEKNCMRFESLGGIAKLVHYPEDIEIVINTLLPRDMFGNADG